MSNSFSDLSPEQKRAEIQAVIDGKTTAAGIALKWMMQDALGLLGHPKADDIADVARVYGGYADNENGLRGTWTLIQQFAGWLAAEQAAHALTRETYAQGAQANAAEVARLRVGIAELCAAGDRFLVALRADQDEATRETYDEVADAKLALAGAMQRYKAEAAQEVK